MFDEDQLLPISALQHLLYCERQCALIHLEQAWADNRWTAEGNAMHEHVHERGGESRCEVRTATGMRLRSLRLGLTGQADDVEFHRAATEAGDLAPAGAVPLPGLRGWWRPFPVEFKRGKIKSSSCDEVQLCAQAICLEEMLGVEIADGALFYGSNRRRHAVQFTAALRDLTGKTAARLHALIAAGVTPPPVYEKAKCGCCSLLDMCQPRACERQRVDDYLEACFAAAAKTDGEGTALESHAAEEQ